MQYNKNSKTKDNINKRVYFKWSDGPIYFWTT